MPVQRERRYVFYGVRRRFSGEIPFENADAWLSGSGDFVLYVAPDLNGDGRADLLLGKYETEHRIVHSTVYFFPGNSQRLDGPVDVEISAIHLAAGLEANHALGSLDLGTRRRRSRSQRRRRSDQRIGVCRVARRVAERAYYSAAAPQLHIYYGVPAIARVH